jgi:hypothetical protein
MKFTVFTHEIDTITTSLFLIVGHIHMMLMQCPHGCDGENFSLLLSVLHSVV